MASTSTTTTTAASSAASSTLLDSSASRLHQCHWQLSRFTFANILFVFNVEMAFAIDQQVPGVFIGLLPWISSAQAIVRHEM